MKALTFLVYIVFWELLTIGGAAYVVFGLGHSGWWFVPAAIFSSLSFKPATWIHGIRPKD